MRALLQGISCQGLGAERLLVKKTARDGVTVAVAAEPWEVRFG